MSIPDPRAGQRRRQRGLSLVELLAAMAVGLLVIATAFSTLLLTRSAAAGISALSQLQQQGSHALHLIGQQLRQARSLEPWRDDATALYAFAAQPGDAPPPVTGTEGAGGQPDSVSIAYARGRWPAGSGSPRHWAQYDCTGTNVEDQDSVRATFSLDAKGNLMCRGVKTSQPVIDNVADFQVDYRVDIGAGFRHMDASAVQKANLWPAVTAVEVCIDLRGDEKGLQAAGAYRGCGGDERPHGGRTHLVFRNLFHLRNR
ncbi:prepilin-type N-terminal cleavage/methylation domain-containing protein [Variovorax sp. J22P271]|uniref:prepilin-type N-terminal cleavage/methylation domain-containing protein n=1 Tax=Variovorax davisae TaxID=3053515 RepID=UPI002577FE73|nr:prepilin-type N-terminal cleavage/methylation domain-containing protein [Variovorax sp. J22P271]MDM0030987.1 prepilin-type N-terminal cleavage/methylation domain-containing protein [Variovorax sp. J22P271]